MFLEFCFALHLAPSAPPHLAMVQDVTTTSMKLLWSPPEKSHRNGIITEYGLCYQEASLEATCLIDVQIPGEQLSYDITEGLRPNTEYMLLVSARTAVGFGPKAVLYESTLPSGMKISEKMDIFVNGRRFFTNVRIMEILVMKV